MMSLLAASPAADGNLLRAVEAGIELGLSLLGLGLAWRGVPIGVLASLAPPIGSSPRNICSFKVASRPCLQWLPHFLGQPN